jgi:hypothetical protein
MSTQKSEDITGTPGRKMTEVTQNVKKTSEREQDRAKKSRKDKKNDLLRYFGDGARVPGPTNKGSPSDAVKQQRENRDMTTNNATEEAGDREGGKMKSALKKSNNQRQTKQANQTKRQAKTPTQVRGRLLRRN